MNRVKNKVQVPFIACSWAERSEAQRDRIYHSLSHIFRTPLVGVKGYVDYLMQGYAGRLCKEHEKYIGYIRDGVLSLEKHMGVFMDIIAFDLGLVVPSFEVKDLAEVFADSVVKFKSFARMRKVRLLLDTPGCPVYAGIDSRWFDTVVFELVFNSIRVAPENSEVKIKVRQDKTAKIEIMFKATNMAENSIAGLFQMAVSPASDPRARKSGENIVREMGEFHTARLEHIMKIHKGLLSIKHFNKTDEMEVVITVPGAKNGCKQ